jgi:mannose/cellobiose epimerase-like protein (N-acyl-D-glucosamine 2-epimerase family)
MVRKIIGHKVVVTLLFLTFLVIPLALGMFQRAEGIAEADRCEADRYCEAVVGTISGTSANNLADNNTNEEKAYLHLYGVMDKYVDFYVYRDKNAPINHYIPSAWMGDVGDVTFEDNWTSNPHSGESCIKLTYSAIGSSGQNWAGIYWQYPEGNWGNDLGYNLTGATAFSFWARGEIGNEQGEFKIGGINRPPYHNPALPYQDSFGPLTTDVVTLTNTWEKYTIDLTDVNLSNVIGGFCWVTNKPDNPSGCTIYLDDIMYENRNQLRFLGSYESTPTVDNDYMAWTYDNALALLAFTARDNTTDRERTRILADSFLYVQNHDQTFSDGRVRDGYWATDIKNPSGENSSIKSPGSGTGNMAWTIIALLRYYEVTKNETYLTGAKRLGNWIYDNCNDPRGVGGYTGGYEDKNVDWELEKIEWKSTEHNIDVYVAFMKLYEDTGNSTWREKAQHAKKFIEAMWDEEEGHFWTGTLNDGETINKDCLPEDVNTWGLMVLGNLSQYGRGITWVENICLVDPCPSGCGFKGFDFNDDKDGVWFEGTAHMSIAYQIKNETSKSDDFINEIRSAQTANNSNGKGVVAACHDGVTTGFGWGYPNALHIGATSWYIFAERNLNPYWGITTSDSIPYQPFDTGEGTYPSISGTFTGTITPAWDRNVSTLFTYNCKGTGGHTKSIELYENDTAIASGQWDGYQGDWYNITLSSEVTLIKDHEYQYVIVTGSYPQIVHTSSRAVTGGVITCTEFVDANGKTHTDSIPAIKLS